jgi:hypothetical protein
MAEITFRLQSEEINKEVLQQLVGVAEAFNTSVFRLLENDEAKAVLVKRILELSAQDAITIDPYKLLNLMPDELASLSERLPLRFDPDCAGYRLCVFLRGENNCTRPDGC